MSSNSEARRAQRKKLLEGKTALVTGSTDGVGRLVAIRLAELGAHVLVHGRDRNRGEQVLDQIRNVDPDRYAAEVPEPFPAILRGTLVREARQRSLTMDRIAEMLR